MPLPVARDLFRPVLLSSPPLVVTGEQAAYIKAILGVSCSDSKFADKAWDSIWFVLTSGIVKPPVVASLNPENGETGAVVTLHVMGTNFHAQSKVAWDNNLVDTVYVSATELTAVVTPTGAVARDIPVHVFDPTNSVLSNGKMFHMTVPA